MNKLKKLMQNCTKCSLHEGRTQLVFSSGNPNSKLVLLGEAPGEEEDIQGTPFVGKAGDQLNRILEFAGIQRDDIYIMNPVLCRPPNNRNPLGEELEACKPRMLVELVMIKPELIVCMGKVAVTSLFGEFKGPLKQFFDQDMSITLEDHTSKVIVTYHPSALMRNGNFKRNSIPHWTKIKEWYAEPGHVEIQS